MIYFQRRQVQRAQRGGILLHSLITLVLITLSFVLGYIIGKQRAENKPTVAEPTSLEDILKRELAKNSGDEMAKKEAQLVSKLAESSNNVTPTAPAPSADESSSKGSSRYTLQLGSFKNSTAAEKLQQELKKKSVSATVHKVDIDNKGTWWRVQVGSYVS